MKAVSPSLKAIQPRKLRWPAGKFPSQASQGPLRLLRRISCCCRRTRIARIRSILRARTHSSVAAAAGAGGSRGSCFYRLHLLAARLVLPPVRLLALHAALQAHAAIIVGRMQTLAWLGNNASKKLSRTESPPVTHSPAVLRLPACSTCAELRRLLATPAAGKRLLKCSCTRLVIMYILDRCLQLLLHGRRESPPAVSLLLHALQPGLCRRSHSPELIQLVGPLLRQQGVAAAVRCLCLLQPAQHGAGGRQPRPHSRLGHLVMYLSGHLVATGGTDEVAALLPSHVESRR